MSEIESYDELKNKARVGAGWKGGPFFNKPVEAPARHFENGIPSEVKEKLQGGEIKQGTPDAVWKDR